MSEIKISKEINEIKEKIKELNLGQISELIDGLKKDLNIQEQAIVQTTTANQSEEKVEEKSGNVSVKWVKMEEEGKSMFPLLGDIVKAIADLEKREVNKVEAKRLAEKGEQIILTNIPRDEAKKFQAEMKEKGAIVEIVEIK
jgi:ribosomal protein L7/L12